MATSVAHTSNHTHHSLGRLLLGWIDAPATTFQAITGRRKWWLWAAPLVIIILALAVFAVVSAPHTLELAREQAQRQLASMPAEQAEAARAMLERTTSLPYVMTTTIISGAVMLLLVVLAQATFLYFGALVSGGEVAFGPVFTISAWTRLPFALHMLTQAGFIAVTGRMIQYQGLAFLVSTGDIFQDGRNPLFVLLSQINLFWLWHLFLVVVGLTVVARFSRGKSLLLTVIYAVLALGITVLPVILFGSMMGG